VQTLALACRNFLSFVEEGNSGNVPVPADELVTRKDLEAFKKEIVEALQDARRQVAPQQPAAASITQEKDSMLQRMRRIAD
jgi:DNA-binding protein YbaB